MITLDLDHWLSLISGFLWPFMRLLALIGAAPVLGESAIPMRVKVALAALLTIVIMPSLAPMPDIPLGGFASLWVIGQQVFIGLAMALVLRIAFAAVTTAGEFVGLQMGLSFASFFDPATGANTAVLSRLMNMVAMLIFISLDAHLLLLASVMASFDFLPIAYPTALQLDGWGVLFDWSAQVMLSGMLLALPLIIILLTISLSMGILNRTAQQLSVFAVGFPVSLMTGLTLLATILPQAAPFLSDLFQASHDAMANMIFGLAQDSP